MKKIINISLVMLLSILLITGCGKKTNNNDNNQNNEQKETQNISENTNVIGSQTIGSLKFEIKSLKYENEVSILEYVITNETQDEIIMPSFKMTITDGEKKLYVLNMSYKDKKLSPNESITSKKEIKKDLTEATSITFELIEE